MDDTKGLEKVTLQDLGASQGPSPHAQAHHQGSADAAPLTFPHPPALLLTFKLPPLRSFLFPFQAVFKV